MNLRTIFLTSAPCRCGRSVKVGSSMEEARQMVTLLSGKGHMQWSGTFVIQLQLHVRIIYTIFILLSVKVFF